MTTDVQEKIRARAIAWHIALRDGGDAAWDIFADWLAEDPAHLRAYEEIEQADYAIGPLLPDLVFRQAANDADAEPQTARPSPSRRRWVFGGGALAASVAGLLWLAPHTGPDRYEVATAAGQSRIVTLDPTTLVTLNGATRMRFERGNPRFASLVAGEALFDIRHDSSHPFTLEVGHDQVEDVGTVFNVVRDDREVRIAVAEGKVVFNPRGDAIPLDAGQGLVANVDTATVQLIRTPASAVGSWQRRQLVYRGEPLSQVADDLSRALGIRIVVSPAIASRPFHGTIALDGSRPEILARLRQALDVDLEAGSDGWNMTPVGGGER